MKEARLEEFGIEKRGEFEAECVRARSSSITPTVDECFRKETRNGAASSTALRKKVEEAEQFFDMIDHERNVRMDYESAGKSCAMGGPKSNNSSCVGAKGSFGDNFFATDGPLTDDAFFDSIMADSIPITANPASLSTYDRGITKMIDTDQNCDKTPSTLHHHTPNPHHAPSMSSFPSSIDMKFPAVQSTANSVEKDTKGEIRPTTPFLYEDCFKGIEPSYLPNGAVGADGVLSQHFFAAETQNPVTHHAQFGANNFNRNAMMVQHVPSYHTQQNQNCFTQDDQQLLYGNQPPFDQPHPPNHHPQPPFNPITYSSTVHFNNPQQLPLHDVYYNCIDNNNNKNNISSNSGFLNCETNQLQQQQAYQKHCKKPALVQKKSNHLPNNTIFNTKINNSKSSAAHRRGGLPQYFWQINSHTNRHSNYSPLSPKNTVPPQTLHHDPNPLPLPATTTPPPPPPRRPSSEMCFKNLERLSPPYPTAQHLLTSSKSSTRLNEIDDFDENVVDYASSVTPPAPPATAIADGVDADAVQQLMSAGGDFYDPSSILPPYTHQQHGVDGAEEMAQHQHQNHRQGQQHQQSARPSRNERANQAEALLERTESTMLKQDVQERLPDPLKLIVLRGHMEKVTSALNEVHVMKENTQQMKALKKKEKNRLASKCCRLKKKALFEANLLIKNGLRNEKQSMLFLIENLRQVIRAHINEVQAASAAQTSVDSSCSSSSTPNNTNRPPRVSLRSKIENMIMAMRQKMPHVAGRTQEYVAEVIESIQVPYGLIG